MAIFISKFCKIRWDKYLPAKTYDWPLDFVYNGQNDHSSLNPYFEYYFFLKKTLNTWITCYRESLLLQKIRKYIIRHDSSNMRA